MLSWARCTLRLVLTSDFHFFTPDFFCPETIAIIYSSSLSSQSPISSFQLPWRGVMQFCTDLDKISRRAAWVLHRKTVSVERHYQHNKNHNNERSCQKQLPCPFSWGLFFFQNSNSRWSSSNLKEKKYENHRNMKSLMKIQNTKTRILQNSKGTYVLVVQAPV